eukprot:gene1785-33205_t
MALNGPSQFKSKESTHLSSSSNAIHSFESEEGIEIFHMLGKGAYGTVYSGAWYGTPVAIKIIDEDISSLTFVNAQNKEAVLGTELRHPHIVSTLHSAVQRSDDALTSSAYAASFQTSTPPVLFETTAGPLVAPLPRMDTMPSVDDEASEYASFTSSSPSSHPRCHRLLQPVAPFP